MRQHLFAELMNRASLKHNYKFHKCFFQATRDENSLITDGSVVIPSVKFTLHEANYCLNLIFQGRDRSMAGLDPVFGCSPSPEDSIFLLSNLHLHKQRMRNLIRVRVVREIRRGE